MTHYDQIEVTFVTNVPRGSVREEMANEILGVVQYTRIPVAVLQNFLRSPQESMCIANDYDELSYIRLYKNTFPPPPRFPIRNDDDIRSVVIFPEENIPIKEEDEEEDIVLGSQDSPRSSESGSVGSLINFLTNSSD